MRRRHHDQVLAGKGFVRIKGYEDPFLGDLPMPGIPKMALRQAIGLLKDAGYKGGFFGVTLRRPLEQQKLPPQYIFTLGDDRYVAVDTKTGKVTPLS